MVPETLKDVLRFDMLTVRHSKEVRHLCCLLRLMRSVDSTSEYRGLDLCCFEDPLDGFYSVKDTDAWWLKLAFEGRQRHHARGPQYVGRHSLEMFA